MNGRGQRPQTANQSRRRGVQKFVSNAVNAVFFGGSHLIPATIVDDFFQRNPVAGAAPRGDHDIRILQQNSFSGSLFPWGAYELPTRCSDQFPYPGL